MNFGDCPYCDDCNSIDTIQIFIKSKFTDWRPISLENAIEYAKWKLRAMTMGKNDEDRLLIINNKMRGVQFTLDELK
jgi:hypothetical protein